MVNRMDTTLLLPDLANQYATASHSVSLRLLAYALQSFPLAEPFAPSPNRSETENLNILRLWADMLVARGENGAAASTWKQVAVWCHHLDDLQGATYALVQAHALLLPQIPPAEASGTAAQLIKFLTRVPDSLEKSESMIVLATSLLELGDLRAAQILRDEAAGSSAHVRLDSALLQAKIFLAQGHREQAQFFLDDLECNPGIFSDVQGARMTIGMFRLSLDQDSGDLAAALGRVKTLSQQAKSEGLLLQQALLSATRTELSAEMHLDQDVIVHGIETLQLFDPLNLGETRRIGIKAILARSLARMGRAKKGIEYAEEVSAWAQRHENLALEQEFTVIAADLAARDLQGIRAAGLYGCAADLYSEQPLLRARYLRKCAVQLVYSAGSDRETTIRWALSLLREAGDLLHGMERDGEVAAELSAWEFDRLWIRTRK